MTIIETLSKVEDMLSLMGHQKDHDLKKYFFLANKQTSVSTDQMIQLIEATKDRYTRTAIGYLESICEKSIKEITNQIDIRLDYMIDTIIRLRQQINCKRDEISRKMNSQTVLDRLIEEEYTLLRDKYRDMLQSSYTFANESMQRKENLHRETLQRYLQDIHELKSAYFDLELNSDEHHDHHDGLSSDLKKPSNSIHHPNRRNSIHRGLKKKPIAQENNELALLTIQEKLDRLFDNVMNQSVESFSEVIKENPLKILKEKKNVYQWKQKHVERLESICLYDLSEREQGYILLVEELSAQLFRLNEYYDEMSRQLKNIRVSRQMQNLRAISSQISSNSSSNSNSSINKSKEYTSSLEEKSDVSNNSQSSSTAFTFNKNATKEKNNLIGSRIKTLAYATEMSYSDIQHMLMALTSYARLK